tara:strand:+ start:58 stop:435 length:378 start_codon:yes stop_codon:yes gene_type:complete
MHCKSYRKRTIKKRGGGPPLGLPRRDQVKQGAPKSRSSNPPPLKLKPVPRSASPIHRLPSSSSSSKKSSSGSLNEKLKSKTKKTRGQQKVRAYASMLTKADRALAKKRNTGMPLLTNIGVAIKGK